MKVVVIFQKSLRENQVTPKEDFVQKYYELIIFFLFMYLSYIFMHLTYSEIFFRRQL